MYPIFFISNMEPITIYLPSHWTPICSNKDCHFCTSNHKSDITMTLTNISTSFTGNISYYIITSELCNNILYSYYYDQHMVDCLMGWDIRNELMRVELDKCAKAIKLKNGGVAFIRRL